VLFLTDINDTGKSYISKFFSFIAGVVDTAEKHSFANIIEFIYFFIWNINIFVVFCITFPVLVNSVQSLQSCIQRQGHKICTVACDVQSVILSIFRIPRN
jgi:hypothetical protein